MVKKDKVFRKGVCKTHIRVVEGYHDENGKVKQRTIKSFGYLEDQKDPKAFLDEVQSFNDQFLKNKNIKKDSFSRYFYEDDYNAVYNYGYRFLEAIYDSLELDKFFDKLDYKCEYDLNSIFKFLTIERILNPDSKRATFQVKKSLYKFNSEFELHDIYRSLDKFNDVKIELQKYINDRIKEIIGRDLSYAYYDVTNYYNEIDYPRDENDLRQRGVSKEHRVDPIIQLGLFIDSNGLPISMSLFKGNTSDTNTLQPIMKEIKNNYDLNRLIVVADKGLNSSSNINYIVNNNDGYVVSQILRGKKGKRYQEKLFTEENYTYNKNRTFKYQLFEEDYDIINLDGKKETRKRKVLIYWKLEDALLEAKKRDDKLARALKSLGNNAYAIKHTYEQYIKELHTVEQTGELADKVNRVIDEEKINEDTKYDGYFCIITSELDYDYEKILEVYGNLWKIEESFKITKSDLEVRPIYVSAESRINGHFITCYVALLIIRMLQIKLKNKLSVERIVRALKTSNCIIEEDNIIKILKNSGLKALETEKTLLIDDDDETLNDFIQIIKSMDAQMPYTRYKNENFDKYLKSIKY